MKNYLLLLPFVLVQICANAGRFISAAVSLKEMISNYKVVLFARSKCKFSNNVKDVLKRHQVQNKVVDVDIDDDGSDFLEQISMQYHGKRLAKNALPKLFVGGICRGRAGCVIEAESDGSLFKWLDHAKVKYTKDEDLIFIDRYEQE